MKRYLTHGFLVAGAVLLAGCTMGGPLDTGDQNEQTRQEAGILDRDRIQDQTRPNEHGSMVDSWIGELASGKKIVCTYSYEDGGEMNAVKMYMDQDRYRTEMRMSAGEYVTVFDGKTSYSWMVGAKEGMMMTIDCLGDLKGTEPQSVNETAPEEEDVYESPEEALRSIPDITCEPVSDIDFSVPKDVTFADQCALIKNQIRVMDDMKRQMPEMKDVPGMTDALKNMEQAQ